jgi:hypothetical protein
MGGQFHILADLQSGGGGSPISQCLGKRGLQRRFGRCTGEKNPLSLPEKLLFHLRPETQAHRAKINIVLYSVLVVPPA